MFAIVVGVLSAIAILVVMFRLGIRKFLGYPVLCDIVGTLILCVILYGTILGMIAAIVGGLVLSAAITLLRKTIGYERLTLKGWKRYGGLSAPSVKISKITKPVRDYWKAFKVA